MTHGSIKVTLSCPAELTLGGTAHLSGQIAIRIGDTVCFLRPSSDFAPVPQVVAEALLPDELSAKYEYEATAAFEDKVSNCARGFLDDLLEHLHQRAAGAAAPYVRAELLLSRADIDQLIEELSRPDPF